MKLCHHLLMLGQASRSFRRQRIDASFNSLEPAVVICPHHRSCPRDTRGSGDFSAFGRAICIQMNSTTQGVLTIGGHARRSCRTADIRVTDTTFEFLQQTACPRTSFPRLVGSGVKMRFHAVRAACFHSQQTQAQSAAEGDNVPVFEFPAAFGRNRDGQVDIIKQCLALYPLHDQRK